MKPLLIILFSSCILVSCSTTRVFYDYDRQQNNFGTYKTYNIYPEIQTGLSELDDKRIFSILDSVLQSKGLKKSDTPDLYIDIVAGNYQERQRNTVGVGVGGTGSNIGFGISGGIPIGAPKIGQQIVFDIIDATKNSLIWQANSVSALSAKASPEQKEIYYQKLVLKVFKKFPPEKK